MASFVRRVEVLHRALKPTRGHLYRSVSSMRITMANRGHAVFCTANEGAEEERPKPSALDIRIGKILSCERHPDADALFVEQIDVGEDEPRTICSGLVPYLKAEELMNAAVVVLCNLKARSLRGVPSHGMLLCASDKEKGVVLPLIPPSDAVTGERVLFGEDVSEPESENRVKKKKIWEKLQPFMKTNEEGVAFCDEQQMRVASGPITCPSLPNASIS